MSIFDNVKADIITAMKAKDEVAKNALKGLKSAFTNELVAQGKTPQDEVTDEIALTVVKRAVKQRKDAMAQFVDGGRQDLADGEAAELAVVEKYLPEMMSAEQIREIAEAKKAELGVDDKAKMGILVGAVMKECAGNADGAVVKDVVEGLFG